MKSSIRRPGLFPAEVFAEVVSIQMVLPKTVVDMIADSMKRASPHIEITDDHLRKAILVVAGGSSKSPIDNVEILGTCPDMCIVDEATALAEAFQERLDPEPNADKGIKRLQRPLKHEKNPLRKRQLEAELHKLREERNNEKRRRKSTGRAQSKREEFE